jgi:glycosyltransferase involved in cell wall biosynthesis
VAEARRGDYDGLCIMRALLPPRIAVVTDMPSPYQVEFFDALYGALKGRLSVTYVRWIAPGRQWTNPSPHHEHCFLSDGEMTRARAWIQNADLAIVSGYRGSAVRDLIALRQRTRRPWAFWGERPGARISGWIGRWLRAVGQRRIRSAGVPIWGIGAWAVEGYKREIGEDRLYLNVPYFSNLDRFLAIDRSNLSVPQSVRFLFSGSLTERKGADLLAQAFTRLVIRGLDAKLTFLGSGALEPTLRKATSPVASNVAFLGFRQWHELPEIYAQSDVLCAPSRYDGWGLIVPEGLAAGMPVIATNMMGAGREMITSSNGWLIRAGNLCDLEEAMMQAARQSLEARMTTSRAAQVAALTQNLGTGVRRIEDAIELSLIECTRRGMNSR